MRRKILLIEDDGPLRELASLALTEAGFAVEATAHGAEALRILEARPGAFAAILLDLGLPDVPGVAVLKRSKQLRPDLPVIVATGTGQEPAEADQIIRKPYGPREILEALHAAASPAPAANSSSPDGR